MKPEIYDRLAASGRYLNTGKVLIGLQYVPKPRQLSFEEERIQRIMLNQPLSTDFGEIVVRVVQWASMAVGIGVLAAILL